ncbi:MAG: I78 family peptidase inhibitor [Pseudomonadota bacterium]
MKTLRALALSTLALMVMSVPAQSQETPAICQAEPAQSFVGGPATQESGAAIIAATGATIFQWVLEGSPVTKDYRRERVRVVYNRDMKVIAVTCG